MFPYTSFYLTAYSKFNQVGTKIVVADLGGGTIDVSSFRVVNPKPLRLQETLRPDCQLNSLCSLRYAVDDVG